MTIEDLRSYCLSLPEVTEKMPFPHFNAGKDILAFYVGGHIFCFFDIGITDADIKLLIKDSYNLVKTEK